MYMKYIFGLVLLDASDELMQDYNYTWHDNKTNQNGNGDTENSGGQSNFIVSHITPFVSSLWNL